MSFSPKEVSSIIIKQLHYTKDDKKRVLTWGVKSWKYGIDEKVNLGFLIFKVNGHNFKGSIKISLNLNDTYRVDFIKSKKVKDIDLTELYGKTKFKIDNIIQDTIEEAYCDNINQVIDEYVEYHGNYSF